MVHKHLHIKESELAVEHPDVFPHSHHEHSHEPHTLGKEVRVSIALLATLAGGVLLLNSAIAPFFFGKDSQIADLLAMFGAILLGAPIVTHAIKSVIRGEMHMDELVALAIIAAFATQQYATAGIVAFFMLCSELVETRTALGARASIESLIKLTPTKSQSCQQGWFRERSECRLVTSPRCNSRSSG
jgi:Zn2+/Cd2+-exporting ATPase